MDLQSKIGLGLAATGLAVGALALVPAFMGPRFLCTGRIPEPVRGVRWIYEGARRYFEEDQAGVPLEQRRFPPSTPRVASADLCCHGSRPGPCPGDLLAWKDPTWATFRFEPLLVRRRYAYHFLSEGAGRGAVFSAAAHGDLDCDGVWSTFEMVGSVGSDGRITGQAAMFKAMITE